MRLRAYHFGIGLWSVVAAVGLWGLWMRLVHGHELANYGSYVTWGLWVSAYIYFIGFSAGAFLVASLTYVFRLSGFERVGRLSLVVALVTLIMGMATIGFDLGHPSRGFEILTRANFHSLMTWMVWLYAAYLVVLLVALRLDLRAELIAWCGQGGWRGSLARVLLAGKTEFGPEVARRDRRLLRNWVGVGILLVVTFEGGAGALFGTVLARPYWHSALYPILFLVGAIVSGTALMTATVAVVWPKDHPAYEQLVYRLGRIVLGLLLLDVLLEWAEFSVPMWYPIGPEYELFSLVLFGPFWWVFWIVHLGIGIAIPAALLAWRPRAPVLVGIACALVAVTFMAVRLNVVVPGLISPELKGLEEAFVDHRLMFRYVPSFFEWAVTCFIVALGGAIFFFTSRLVPVVPANQEVRS